VGYLRSFLPPPPFVRRLLNFWLLIMAMWTFTSTLPASQWIGVLSILSLVYAWTSEPHRNAYGLGSARSTPSLGPDSEQRELSTRSASLPEQKFSITPISPPIERVQSGPQGSETDPPALKAKITYRRSTSGN
jgi:hypothetical protein